MRKRVAGEIILSHLGIVEVSDTRVFIADFFMGIYEIGWVIVSGITEGKLVVVIRTDGYKKNAGKLVQAAFSEVGSAGGHRSMARAEIPLAKLETILPRFSNEAIEDYLISTMGRHLRPLRRLKTRWPHPTSFLL
jgi:nanoRNase/pAp phosphatase (c-di-AMP/oligoRNAs hydrolase)